MIPGIGGSDVLLEQLDADPALEIVLAGVPGYVLDGATQAIDWTYKDGFGAYLAGGHFSDGGGAQFVAARDWDLFTVFQSAPYSPIWDASVFDIDAIAAADLDGDGFDEIIEGDGQWGGVNIYDSRTQQVRLSIPHSAWGMEALAVADFGISGRPSIAFSPIEERTSAMTSCFASSTAPTAARSWRSTTRSRVRMRRSHWATSTATARSNSSMHRKATAIRRVSSRSSVR